MPHNAKDNAAAPTSDSTYKRLLKEHIIWLGTQVVKENVDAICVRVLLLAAGDPGSDIYLYVNSPGGSVTAGMTIYDVMWHIKLDVMTVTMGMVVSMEQFLLTIGTKGKRFVTPHARILMRQPLGKVQGTASEVRISVDLILAMKNGFAQIVAERIGHTPGKTARDADRDHWYTIQGALEHGFIDVMVEDVEIVKKGE